MYANKPCHLWSYRAKVHQIFRWCSPIISAVNAHSYDIAIRFLALVQRMQVVSFDVDNIFATLFGCHGNVPWKIGKWGTDPSSVERFHMVKRLRKSVQYVWRYSTKCASFLAVSYLTFTNKPSQLWSYWTEFHEILTRFRAIIYAVNVYIEIAIAHSVSEWQSDKCRGVGNFAPFLPLNWLPWQRPLRNRKNWTSLTTFTLIPSIWCKNCENRSSRSRDSFAQI